MGIGFGPAVLHELFYILSKSGVSLFVQPPDHAEDLGFGAQVVD